MITTTGYILIFVLGTGLGWMYKGIVIAEKTIKLIDKLNTIDDCELREEVKYCPELIELINLIIEGELKK